MNLSTPLSRALSRSLSGQLGGRGTAANGGPFRISDIGGGDASFRMSGYTHPDPTGYVQIIWDTDIANIEALTPSGFTTNLAYNTTTGTIAIDDPGRRFYVAYVAFDATDNLLYKSNITSLATSNEPLTGFNIVATDTGSGTEFNLVLDWTNPTGYTDLFISVAVYVNDILIYGPTNWSRPGGVSTLEIEDLAGGVMEGVDVYVTVLGRTSVLGAPSSVVSDSDWIVGEDPDVTSYAAEIETESTIELTADQKDFLNDWVLAGDANGWRPFVGLAMFFCWNNLEANLVRMFYGGNGSVALGTPAINTTSMGMNISNYITSGVNASNLSVAVDNLMLCYANYGDRPQAGAVAIGTGIDLDHYRLFAAGTTAYFDVPYQGGAGRTEGSDVSPIRVGVRNGTSQAIHGYDGATVTTLGGPNTIAGTPAINAGDILIGYDGFSSAPSYIAAFAGTGSGMTSTIAGDFLVDTYNLLDALETL